MPCAIPRRRVGLRFDHRLHQPFAIVEVAAEKRPAAVARSIQQRVDELLVLVHQLFRLLFLAVHDGQAETKLRLERFVKAVDSRAPKH